MSDGYLEFSNSYFGKKLCKGLGLPVPPLLRRANQTPEQTVTDNLVSNVQSATTTAILSALNDTNVHQADNLSAKYNGLIFDATTITTTTALKSLYQFFNLNLKQLNPNGKIAVIGLTAQATVSTEHTIVQRSLQGFVKSLAKEVGRKGITANLLLASGSESNSIAGPLRFLMSDRCAYVNAQVISVSQHQIENKLTWQQPLAGKVALVTGAARGIGAAIAQVLARDGATVIGLDTPASQQQLQQTMDNIKGSSLPLSVTDSDAGQQIAQFVKDNNQQLDIIVHNAGVTRDKMLSRMNDSQWELLMDVNLTSILRINQYLLNNNIIAQAGRIIGVSSISGIGGNAGQTNYATSKAGVIGMIEQMAPILAPKQITINAVAPGFIETEMTAAVPFIPRQLGRRLCSLSQGGLPQDVAETIAFLASPYSQGVSANLIRVCGQNIMGA